MYILNYVRGYNIQINFIQLEIALEALILGVGTFEFFDLEHLQIPTPSTFMNKECTYIRVGGISNLHTGIR